MMNIVIMIVITIMIMIIIMGTLICNFYQMKELEENNDNKRILLPLIYTRISRENAMIININKFYIIIISKSSVNHMIVKPMQYLF